MATKINVRSPFYVKYTDDDATYTLKTVQLDIYVYTGESGDSSGNRRYRISKDVLGSNDYVIFEISELVRDYIEIEFNGQYNSQVQWVRLTAVGTDADDNSVTIDPSATQFYIATDGYGYFEEGVNPELSRTYLQSNNKIFRLDDQNVRVPVFAEDTNSVSYFYKGELKRTELITDDGDTNQKIQYITVSGSDNTDTYQQRVLADGGTFEDNSLLDEFLDSIDIGLVDELYIASDSGTEIVKIKTLDCSRYEPIKVTFVNRFGALQDMFFTLKSIESTDIRSEQFKRSMFNESTLSYKTYQHQKQLFHTNGNDRITLNTDYIDEEYNKVIEELMLSEQTWITRLTDEEELVLPVMPKTKSVTYKTSVNDRLVQYTIEFDMAFDKINNIR